MIRAKFLFRLFVIFSILVFSYFGTAYFLLPFVWRHYEHQPKLETAPKAALTKEGFQSDPLNIGLIGTESEIVQAMTEAGWYPADPVTFRTKVGIIKSVLLGRAYPDAPVSNLYLFERSQDLAFEKPAGKSPKARHHVRFWQVEELGLDNRPFWIGASTFDRGVGVSHRTGQITHHIAPDIDTERNHFVDDLKKAGQLEKIYQVTGIGPTIQGANGGGDWYYTDGELTVGVISHNNVRQTKPPEELPNPQAVELKNQFWNHLRHFLDGAQ